MTRKSGTEDGSWYDSEYQCSYCGTRLENAAFDHRESWCSTCWSETVRAILDESPVETGDIVRYNGDTYLVKIGPQHMVFLYDVDDLHAESRPEVAPWVETTDIRNVDSLDLTLRYEVRRADSSGLGSINNDNVFNGFDDYNEAYDAARVWSRFVGQKYGVWSVVESQFVDMSDGDDVVQKDDPVVPCPVEPDISVRELHAEYRQRAAEAARMSWGE